VQVAWSEQIESDASRGDAGNIADLPLILARADWNTQQRHGLALLRAADRGRETWQRKWI